MFISISYLQTWACCSVYFRVIFQEFVKTRVKLTMSEWSGDPGPSTIAGILSVSERFAQEILDFVENDFLL